MKNERTSKRVAKIAAKVLNIKAKRGLRFAIKDTVKMRYTSLSWSDIRALAASCLTQAPDLKRNVLYTETHAQRDHVLSPRIKSKRPSYWPPSAKPTRRSP